MKYITAITVLRNAQSWIFIFFDDSEDFPKNIAIKVLFTDRRMQNFHHSLLRLIDRLYKVIHKIQKTRMKVLSSATVGE